MSKTNDQLKYSFKKENSMFFRKFKFLGIVLAIFGFAVFNPLMGKLSSVMLKQLDQMTQAADQMTAAVSSAQNTISEGSFIVSDGEDTTAGESGSGYNTMVSLYNDCAMMTSTSLVSFATYSLLIVMLVMRSAAGGEQKKRAMIVPMCSGLKIKNYLLPKFIIYPVWLFVLTFLGGMLTCGLCNALFETNKVSFEMMLFGSVLMAVYIMFIVTVYLSLGICTSKAGLMVGTVFLAQMILQTLLESMDLGDYQPFTIVTVVGEMYAPEYDLSAKTASIAVSVGLCVLISVLMYFLALGVLKARQIDNTEEEKPAF